MVLRGMAISAIRFVANHLIQTIKRPTGFSPCSCCIATLYRPYDIRKGCNLCFLRETNWKRTWPSPGGPFWVREKYLNWQKRGTVMSRIASHCIILSNLTAQASPPGSSILNVPRSNTADILDPVHPVLGITRLGHREDCTP